MTNEELKPYLQRSLTTSCPLKFLYEQTQETRTRAQASNNFQFSRLNCPEWKEASNCYRERRGLTFRLPLHVYMFEWFSQQPTLTFLHPCFTMLKLKYFVQGRQKPFSEFQQTAAVETFDKFRYKSSLKPCLYSTWFMFIEFVLKLVVPCEQLWTRGSLFFFSCSRHKTHGGSHLNSKNKQASPECAI